jgi:hypothetical protein
MKDYEVSELSPKNNKNKIMRVYTSLSCSTNELNFLFKLDLDSKLFTGGAFHLQP